MAHTLLLVAGHTRMPASSRRVQHSSPQKNAVSIRVFWACGDQLGGPG